MEPGQPGHIGTSFPLALELNRDFITSLLQLISHHLTKSMGPNPESEASRGRRLDHPAMVAVLQEEEQCLKILLLFWTSMCQGANVFTVHASGLTSDLGIFGCTQMCMFTSTHLCQHRNARIY